MRQFGAILLTVVLAYGALKLWIEGNDDLCSGKDTFRCSDGVVQGAGVALWVLLAVLLLLVIAALIRLGRWVKEQRRYR